MFDLISNFSDSKVWDVFIAQHSGPDGGLLQSWAWGEAQRAYGRKVWRLALEDGGEIVCAWQVIGHALPLGKAYWYVPRPVMKQEAGNRKQELFIDETLKLAKKEGVVFLRVDAGQNLQLKNFGFRKMEKVSVQPLEELVVDITPADEELLSGMKQKTRYNIRLAEKRGVSVSEIPLDDVGFSIFWNLVSSTAARQKIRPHPEHYYRAMFSAFAQAKIGHLLVASWQGKPLSCALISTFNGVATYLHGGSADEHGDVMAPHLLHWEAMRSAKRWDCRSYNLGGVSLTNAAWAGITRFKQGFAPTVPFIRYGGLWEYPVKPGVFCAYSWLQKIRHPMSRRNIHR